MAGIDQITTATPAPVKSTAKQAGMLDKDAFLRLLVEQLRHQDPTSPADSSQWTAQMAQFSTVEQLTNLAKTSADSARSAQVNEAVALLGRSVSYVNADKVTVSGVVQAVDLDGQTPTLTISGTPGVAPTALINVA